MEIMPGAARNVSASVWIMGTQQDSPEGRLGCCFSHFPSFSADEKMGEKRAENRVCRGYYLGASASEKTR